MMKRMMMRSEVAMIDMTEMRTSTHVEAVTADAQEEGSVA
jgi:hypothetical protein